ncbi:putative Ig domain-containing protein [Dyella ginsengisoli]|uniref:putative Ig domain-containing protein n=1 Tax=Dyella ginsengisoli TaxID=363848 RepID=UPI0003488E80|nr:putative Ig domain-containing protein [Dyella ginsengisoli]
MVAVISGNGLGLLGTSASALRLGSQGGLGQSGASQYVNVATGNLVLQQRDEQLVAQGLLAGLTRTYNSLGSTGDVGAGAWLLGLDRRLGALSGSLNTAGSTITRDGGDGEEEIFTYDATRGLYVGTTQSGAEDTLAWSAGDGTWTYTGGGDRMQETYSGAGVLTDLTDGKSGAHYKLSYNPTTQQLTSVMADDGEGLSLEYQDGRVSSLSTMEIPTTGGAVTTVSRVSYHYDSLGRLQTVTTDLTPDNTTDASTFSTTYTYDGDSLRVASLTQSDGVTVGYTYAQDSQGNYRVASVTTGSGTDAQTLSFSYDLTNQSTTVTDASSRVWTYGYDAAGNLTSVTSPAVNGQRQVTSYTYTADGHLASMTDALGNTTIYRYDDRGNRILERDAAGNTVTSTYSADDQLLTRTVYRTPDPDGTDAADAGAPADPSTTRYVYDSQDRLRFVIDADGVVQETQYDNPQGLISATRSFAAGQAGQVGQSYDVSDLAIDAAPDLATMITWAAAQDLSRSTLVEYSYDAITGRLTQHIAWDQVDTSGNGVADAGESITRYSYDGQGLLRQQITVRGSDRTTLESVSYAYDGLGRLQSRTDDVNQAVTSYNYQDGQGTVAVSYANGRVHTEVRNSAGELVTVTESATGETTRTTQYVYDADGQLRAVQDVGGGISYTFYDAAGQVAGTVDDTGAVTRLVRDADGAVVETVQYATRVDTTGWLSNGAVGPSDLASILPTASADDRTTLSLHDAAGQHVADVDALGNVTEYGYDGAGSRVSTTAYATPLSAAQLSALQGTPALATLLADLSTIASPQDRTSYVLYDLAHRPVATLDAQGYVTTTAYDGAGRVMKTVAYTKALASDLGHPPSLETLLANLNQVTGTDDQVTRFYYDNRGDLVAQVDADGYLTTTTYDETNHSVITSRYSKALAVGQLTGQESVTTLVDDASGSKVQTAVTQYDAEGRVHQVTAADGTVTAYEYEYKSAGYQQSITITPPNGGQVRTASTTYDAFGDLQASTDGAHATTTHQYNARGQETLKTDALGNTVWSYYDAAGRLAYRVVGQPNGSTLNAWGEVTAYTYNAFGQVTTSRQLAGRVTLTTGSSSGSTVNPDTAALADLAAASTALANPAQDAIQAYQYTLDGQVASVLDGNGYEVAYTYDAFGEVVQQQRQLSQPGQALSAGNSTITTYSYDLRGERTGETDDVGGLNRTTGVTYDAFGRVTSRTDARGSTTSTTYDALGRQVTQSQTVQGTVRTTQTSYDAYGRVVTQTDAMGQVTSYQYPDLHTTTITTPDGVVVTKVTDAYGDTLSVTDGAGNVTHYTYDGDGRLLHVTDALLQTQPDNVYDADSHLLQTTDTTGHVVKYSYDASGRVLTRTVDPSGLNQVTSYTYDGRGQTLSVTDPHGAVTTYAYDASGNVLTMVQQAEADKFLTTTYTWDGAGHQLSVTEGVGTNAARTTQYIYDNLGRRIRTVVDPGNGTNPNTNAAYLNLTTDYAYDGNGNLVTVTDPNRNVARTVYDEANEKVYTIDPSGAVVQAFYDADGRVTATRTYATPIDLVGLSTAPTLADVASRVAQVTDYTIDQRRYTVYDNNGRVHYTVDPLGYITEQRYDAAGRPSETLTYAYPISNQAFNSANLFPAMVAGTAYSSMGSLISAAGNTDANAEVTLKLYDADGEVRFVVQQNTVNGQLVGQVSERRYDAAGRVISDIAYGTTIPLSTSSALSAQLSSADSVTQALAGSTNYHQTRYVYDQAGRLRYTIDAGGYVTERQYSSTGPRTETNWNYVIPIYLDLTTIPDALTEADVAAAVSAAVAANTTSDTPRFTRDVYDLAGRLTSVVDGLKGGSSPTKMSYTYDDTGLKLTETNRDGAVWTYQYDAAGRQIRQISPAVTIATYITGNTLSTTSAPVITALTYDANGNVTTRTDGYGTAAARTITYTYDSRNHQTTTTYPDAGYVDTSGVFHATSSTGVTTATVTYDALDHAVVSKDVRGHYAYKAYNLDGELAYDVDANGYVTAYTYDAYGNQTGVTRYATALNTNAIGGWSAGQPLSAAQITGALTASGSDRTINTTYDQANRKTSVVQSAITYVLAMGNNAGQGATDSPTTTYAYDAYGNVVKTSVLIQGAYGTVGQSNYSAETWATTYSYYNALNEKVMDVDPMGYVTTWAYNGAGQVTSTTEYANAIATSSLTTATVPGLPAAGTVASGSDRTTTISYDSIGRKSQQVQSGEYSYVNGTAAIASGSSTTSFGYDGEDRVTSLTVNGAKTTTTYDALGRVLTVTEPSRAVLVSNWQTLLAGSASINLSSASLYVQASPVTTITYDALGNAVCTVRSGTGATAETTYDHYDVLGRQITESVLIKAQQGTPGQSGYVAAVWDTTYSAYDQAGNLTKTWFTLTGSSGSVVVTTTATYDNVNQRMSTVVTRAGVSTPDSAQYVTYNAFGEVTARGDTVDGNEAVFTYNNAGQQTSAPASSTGAIHSYGYDLAGHLDFDGYVVTGGGSRTWTFQPLDLDGRAEHIRAPANNAASGVDAGALTTLSYDRWGNVLSRTDSRGYTTTFLYDSQNHVIKQIEAEVMVVGTDGSRTWQTPVKQWFYDVNGRLIGVTDENNHSSWNTYNAAGQLTQSQDATLAKSYTAYDVFGHALAQQTPPVDIGLAQAVLSPHITTTTYDLGGRVTGLGDYTVETTDGTYATRIVHTLQTYVLNENGDRIAVTDAIGNSGDPGTNPAAYTSYYEYDSQHRVLKSQSAVQKAKGVADTVVYDVNGNKVSETDADGNIQTWSYDYFGRVQAHTDLSGAKYTYAYDPDSGLLTTQTSTWDPKNSQQQPLPQTDPGYVPSVLVGTTSEVDFTYYASGLVQQKTEKTGSQTSASTLYQYDASGNVTDVVTNTVDGAGQNVHNETVTRYDSHNRLWVVTNQDAVTKVGLMRTAYNYDAAGNRRAAFVQSAFGSNASPIGTGEGGPTVSSIGAKTVQPGQAWSFDASSAFTDPLGFGLTFTESNFPPWLHLSTDGVLSSNNPSTAGSWSITLVATDASGASVSTTFTVTIPVVSPVFTSGITPPTGKIGTAISFSAPSATDANGATVTYTAEYANGSQLPGWLNFNATTRTFSGTPPAGSINSYSLRVLANASNGGSAALDFTFVVASTPPVYQGGLTAQTALSTRAFSYAIPPSAFYENDQTTLTYVASGMPGWMSFNATTHVFSGTPPTSDIGNNYFISVTATNPQGQSAAGGFSINTQAYVQPPPVYNGGYTNQTGVIGGSSITINKPANAFTEPDGGALTYSAMVLIPQHDLDYPVNGGTDVATRTIPAQWVSISQVGLSINATSGAISGVPATLNYLISEVTNTYQKDSSYQLEVIATNGQGGTAAGQFTLANSFALPTQINALSNVTANPGQGGIIEVNSNTFSDPYGGGLTYTAKLTNGSNLPSGITWGGSAIYVGTVISGSYGIQVIATDKLGRTAAATFTLTVNNAAPAFMGSAANQTAVSGAAMAAYTAPSATDKNGDTITYSATGMPPGVSFNASTRTFSGKPTSTGSYTVTYKASDSRGGVTSTTFTITVSPPANQPPVYNGGISVIQFYAGRTSTWKVPSTAFSNPTGRALTYSIKRQDGTALGSAYSWNSTTGTLTATLPSSSIDRDFYVVITATDSVDGMSASTTCDLIIFSNLPSKNMLVLSAPLSAQTTTTATSTASPNVQAYWFMYDADNRVTVSNGQLVNGQILVSSTDAHSYSQSYDAAGNVVAVTQYDTANALTTQQKDYDERNELLRTWWPVTSGGGKDLQETRRYDADGHLTVSDIYFQPGSNISVQTTDGTLPLNYTGWLTKATVNTYDADGHITSSSDYARPSGDSWLQTAALQIDQGRLSPDQEKDPGTSGYGLLQLNSQVLYSNASGASGYDGVGNLTVYRYTSLNSSTQTWTTNTYTTTYYRKDSYLEKATAGTSTDSNAVSSTVTGIYDNFGQRIDLVTHYNNAAYSDQVRAFAYDGNGQILERRDGTVSSGSFTATGGTGTHHYAYVNGQQVAEVDEGGHINALGGLTAFSNGDSGTQSYTAQVGDTLASIAQQVYGTSTLWYVVANANGLSKDSDLVFGTTLKLPEVTTSTNDATTFKPYSPAEISGSTTPALPQAPPPPSSHHCSALAQIIVIAVVVVATIATAGAAAVAMGATEGIFAAGAAALSGSAIAGVTVAEGLAAAAIGGFVGSVAGQLTGDMLGVSNGFSFGEALGAGLGAGFTAGLGGLASGGESLAALEKANTLAADARIAGVGAAGAIGGYAGEKLAGQQAHFSWANVAAAAVSAEATSLSGLPGKLDQQFGLSNSTFGQNVVGGLVSGAVSSETARLLGGHGANSGQIVRDAFGNALGSAAMTALNAYQVRRTQEAQDRAEAAQVQSNSDARGGFFNAYPASGADQSGWPSDPLDSYNPSDYPMLASVGDDALHAAIFGAGRGGSNIIPATLPGYESFLEVDAEGRPLLLHGLTVTDLAPVSVSATVDAPSTPPSAGTGGSSQAGGVDSMTAEELLFSSFQSGRSSQIRADTMELRDTVPGSARYHALQADIALRGGTSGSLSDQMEAHAVGPEVDLQYRATQVGPDGKMVPSVGPENLDIEEANRDFRRRLGGVLLAGGAPALFAGPGEVAPVPEPMWRVELQPTSWQLDSAPPLQRMVPDTAPETISPPSFTPYRSELGLDFETQTAQTSNGTTITVQSNQTVAADGSIVDQGSTEFPANQLRATFNSQTGNLNIDWLGASPQQSGLGTEMVSRAIEQLGPENVTSISGDLDASNEGIYDYYYNDLGYSSQDALQMTPAAKIRATLGYSNVGFNSGGQVVGYRVP